MLSKKTGHKGSHSHSHRMERLWEYFYTRQFKPLFLEFLFQELPTKLSSVVHHMTSQRGSETAGQENDYWKVCYELSMIQG